MVKGLVLTKGDSDHLPNVPYRSLLGSLMWLGNNTRPDILFPVIYLSRFAHCYTLEHYEALLRVAIYVYYTRHYRLTYCRDLAYRGGEDVPVEVCSDASFCESGSASDVLGHIITLFSMPIEFSTCRDPTWTLSTFHAELASAVEAAKSVIFATNIINETGFMVHMPIPFGQDNTAVAFFAETETNSKPSRHFLKYLFFLRKMCRDRLAYLYYLPSAYNLSDVLTKAVPVDLLHSFCRWCFRKSFSLSSPQQPIAEVVNLSVMPSHPAPSSYGHYSY
jgi:hypothetical protein